MADALDCINGFLVAELSSVEGQGYAACTVFKLAAGVYSPCSCQFYVKEIGRTDETASHLRDVHSQDVRNLKTVANQIVRHQLSLLAPSVDASADIVKSSELTSWDCPFQCADFTDDVNEEKAVQHLLTHHLHQVQLTNVIADRLSAMQTTTKLCCIGDHGKDTGSWKQHFLKDHLDVLMQISSKLAEEQKLLLSSVPGRGFVHRKRCSQVGCKEFIFPEVWSLHQALKHLPQHILPFQSKGIVELARSTASDIKNLDVKTYTKSPSAKLSTTMRNSSSIKSKILLKGASPAKNVNLNLRVEEKLPGSTENESSAGKLQAFISVVPDSSLLKSAVSLSPVLKKHVPRSKTRPISASTSQLQKQMLTTKRPASAHPAPQPLEKSSSSKLLNSTGPTYKAPVRAPVQSVDRKLTHLPASHNGKESNHISSTSTSTAACDPDIAENVPADPALWSATAVTALKKLLTAATELVQVLKKSPCLEEEEGTPELSQLVSYLDKVLALPSSVPKQEQPRVLPASFTVGSDCFNPMYEEHSSSRHASRRQSDNVMASS